MDLNTRMGMAMHLLRRLFHRSATYSLFVPREYNISSRHGSLHANIFLFGRSYGTKDENKVPLNQELNVKALSTQRLEDFFANEDFKSSSPASWVK